ncbi:permease-like cell division protein FtsX [soil metagenome]
MYLKTALSNIRRSPFQAVAAILVLSVSFFVASVIAILIYSSNQVLNYFETRPQVIAFIKSDTAQSDIDNFETKLKNNSEIKDIKFVSKEDALNIYKNATSNNPLLGQLVSPSIFPSSLEFSVKDLTNASKIIDQTKKEPIVDSVSFTASIGDENTLKDVIGRLTRITFYIRVGGLVLAAVLALTSFLVVMVIVGMRVATKKNEIETLKLMGATPGFIKSPIIFEAIIYVTFGVLIGWVMELILVLYASPTLINYFASIPILPKNTGAFFELNLMILGVELVIGFVIAIFGGWMAVSRATSK